MPEALNHPVVFIVVAVLFGLIIGSFINVVAYRLPIMLERQWRSQCLELLEQEPEEDLDGTYNLVVPESRCPSCDTPIKPWHNIPVFGWLFLRGRCSHCGTEISLYYPLVELTGGVLAGIVAWQVGPGIEAMIVMAFTWTLLALAVIDLREQLLPDTITLPLLWAGLVVSLFGYFVEVQSAVIGAIAGYVTLWIVYWVFRLLTGKEGLGYGDFKLFAAFGAWMGWQALPVIIVMSSVVGAVVGVTLMLVNSKGWGQRLPFGPFLAGAAWLTLIWGDELLDTYYSLFGIL
ncbi:MAG: prepilin peptidase [Gammaproteobacteria bacterium]|nr:prepilin peptidase [Gammaproteobacteria bacterium]MCP5137760.1 prepilin peptidase [Gammaproteobacteria bacterium]